MTFANGVAKFCLMAPDVGNFSVSLSDEASPADGTSSTLRARPHHFTLSDTSITQRSDLPACAGSTFGYMGEPFRIAFKLKAWNQDNVPTKNYAGSFVQFAKPISGDAAVNTAAWINSADPDSMGLWMVAPGYVVGSDTCTAKFSGNAPSHETTFVCDGGSNVAPVNRTAGPRVVVSMTPEVPSMVWSNGEGTFSANVMLHRADKADGAYETLEIGIAPRDADGVALDVLDMDADKNGANERARVGTTKLRYGRLKIANAHGSERLPLPINVQAQYWNGKAYITNVNDGCTPLVPGNFIKEDRTGESIETSIAATGTLSAGTGRIALSKPTQTPAGKGVVTIKVDDTKLPYLPGAGTATFGIYKSGPVIYRRELHY
ncbi:hypothetical protein D3870_10590 [Noviherbaspirillum cavernae]|uniref:DUF6701 domain-containing protein n=1 Tax=Noviherbaspirillum cavernae TaxID=2320862 RepID=A0A418X1S5_9BURK|nr:hypothetical protein D3870_10590 [Noviherbaspirillum cavernae]